MSLEVLPLDVLLDNVLVLLDARALMRLARCSADLQRVIDSAAAIWRRLLVRDYSFPLAGRRSGWRQLYAKMARSALFVWGQNGNGRMGMTNLRMRLIDGGLPLPTRLKIPGASLVDIAAGGWSFHALAIDGRIYSWGTMDGESFAAPSEVFAPGTAVHEPLLLPTGHFDAVQIDAGRKHTVVRGRGGEVFEYFSFGRIYQVLDPAWSGVDGQDRVMHVDAGWGHSALLTSRGAVYVWWEFGAGEHTPFDPPDVTVLADQTLVTASSIKLPAIPVSPATHQPDTIVKIASGADFLIALTASAAVYHLDLSPVGRPGQPRIDRVVGTGDDSPTMRREDRQRLRAAFLSGERAWTYLPQFCEMESIAPLLEEAQRPSPDTKITHISAHFHNFAAYAVPSDETTRDSVVLIGTTHDAPPTVIPELQGKGVIKVTQGDYSWGAVTSSGRLLTWGSYSAGALGLGHPSLPRTVLAHPDLATGSISPLIYYPAPQEVPTPTMVRFSGESAEVGEESGASRTNGTFVFNATMGGWHSAALCIKLDDEDDEEQAREGEERVSEVGSGSEITRAGVPIARGDGRVFRLGYAARGMNRGT